MAKLKKFDGNGEVGGLSQAILFDDNGYFLKTAGYKPIVGFSLLVGSVIAREKDYYLTKKIINIIVDDEDYVKFETIDGVYEWWSEKMNY